MPERLTIVCFSSQPWEDGMWTNKQHVMSRVSKQHRVVFVNFGNQSPFKFVARARQRNPRTPVRLHNAWSKPAVRRINDSLEVIDVWAPTWLNFLPRKHWLRERLDFEHRVNTVGRFLAAEGIRDAVLWVYHPGYGDAVARLPHRLVVYDCVDEYTAFPEFRHAKAWIAERERKLCALAGVVSCTAPALAESKELLAPGRTHLVHNVGDGEHFAQAMAEGTVVPDDIKSLPRPTIGFIGAVSDYKLNTEWLVHLARAKPAWSLVLVGPAGVADPGTDVAALQALPNVHLLGHRAYDALPSYLKGFDVAVIPYRINDYTRAVFPIKFFEFLASGRPVVISPLPAVQAYWGAVRVAESPEAFVAQCEAALTEADPTAQQQRLELAKQNSWDSRVNKLLGLVEAALAS
ncbi:MAG TPA: glycosyltransferase [Polyangiaceae bacterium]|nr:glycosyltransferase [Polyangiaceae bacterium]